MDDVAQTRFDTVEAEGILAGFPCQARARPSCKLSCHSSFFVRTYHRQALREAWPVAEASSSSIASEPMTRSRRGVDRVRRSGVPSGFAFTSGQVCLFPFKAIPAVGERIGHLGQESRDARNGHVYPGGLFLRG